MPRNSKKTGTAGCPATSDTPNTAVHVEANIGVNTSNSGDHSNFSDAFNNKEASKQQGCLATAKTPSTTGNNMKAKNGVDNKQ
jgi:hypothetical protein